MIRLLDGTGKNNEWIISHINRRSQLDYAEEKIVVEKIIKDIKEHGDSALINYTKKFDTIKFQNPMDIIVTQQEIENAYSLISPRIMDIIKRAAERIRKFHDKQKNNSWVSFDEEEIILGQRIQPLERVGVYVPGGRAAYPSSVLMNIIPAKVAGVEEIIMVTPPQTNGEVNPNVIVAAIEAGVDKIFKVGGAQAVAAMAFGTDTIPKVDKIVGPGNIFVTLAKKEVYGYVDIDMIAGPSEIVILADDSANPAFIAADLMSQAEHDPMASAVLITTSMNFAQVVREEILQQIPNLSMNQIIKSSLMNFGALIVVDSMKQAVDLANYFAPEHLELALENPFNWLSKIKHAGAVFIGEYSPEPVGDYMAGPNHVLPTSGTARFFSPLNVEDFIKKSSIIYFSKKGLEDIHEDIIDFAHAEGLTAHANSIEIRFKVN